MSANGMRANFWVWGWLLALTGIEVFLEAVQAFLSES